MKALNFKFGSCQVEPGQPEPLNRGLGDFNLKFKSHSMRLGRLNHSIYLSLNMILVSEGCLVQVGNGIELEAVGLQFEPYRWRPCGVTWDSSRTVVVIKLRRTSALSVSGRLNYSIRSIRDVLSKLAIAYSELDTVGRQFEPRLPVAPLWCDLGRCSRTVVARSNKAAASLRLVIITDSMKTT